MRKIILSVVLCGQAFTIIGSFRDATEKGLTQEQWARISTIGDFECPLFEEDGTFAGEREPALDVLLSRDPRDMRPIIDLLHYYIAKEESPLLDDSGSFEWKKTKNNTVHALDAEHAGVKNVTAYQRYVGVRFLQRAIIAARDDAVRYLLDTQKVDPNTVDAVTGLLPLALIPELLANTWRSFRRDNLLIITDQLLAKGAKPDNGCEVICCYTPLHYGIQFGAHEFMNRVLQYTPKKTPCGCYWSDALYTELRSRFWDVRMALILSDAGFKRNQHLVDAGIERTPSTLEAMWIAAVRMYYGMN